MSIIIPNYNGKHLLYDCLISLSKQTYKESEIILVDNGSVDGSAFFVRDKFPSINIIELKENMGFATGCNAGIKIATGKYLLIINNDTWSEAELVGELIRTMEEDAKVGMAAPKILNFYNRRVMDSVGVGIFFDGTSKGNMRFEIDDGSFNKPHEILCPSGCAAFYRKEMLDDIGLFDEDFFAYCEDTDLGLRAQLAGWKGYFCPKAIVYHKYSGTAKPFSDKKVYWVERNRIWVCLKNFPLPLLFLSLIFSIVRYCGSLSVVFQSNSSINNFIKNYSATTLIFTILKSHISAFLSLKNVLSKRKIINRRKRISNFIFVKTLWMNRVAFRRIID